MKHTRKKEHVLDNENRPRLILERYEREHRGDIAMKIFNGRPLSKEEYYDAVKYGLLMVDDEMMPTYDRFKIRFYEDNKIVGWISLSKKPNFPGYGIPVSRLKKEYLTPKQIDYILENDFKIEEIGSEAEQQ